MGPGGRRLCTEEEGGPKAEEGGPKARDSDRGVCRVRREQGARLEGEGAGEVRGLHGELPPAGSGQWRLRDQHPG